MIFIKKPYFSLFTFILLLSTPHFSFSIQPHTDTDDDTDQTKQTNHLGGGGGGGRGGSENDWYTGPGSGFRAKTGFFKGWTGNGIVGGGYGGGYGGPKGWHTKTGVLRPSVVCKQRGPCYKKKVTCPAKCFMSYSRSGKNFGGGGGGGGCTIECKKKCIAYC